MKSPTQNGGQVRCATHHFEKKNVSFYLALEFSFNDTDWLDF